MKKSRFILLTSLLLGSVYLSSCSFMGDTTYHIESVETKKDTSGNTVFVIHFTDSTIPDYSFTLPESKKGVGITTVSSVISPDGNSLILTIVLSDNSTKTVTVPINNGKNGRSIEKIEEYINENNEACIAIYFVNESEPTILLLPKGEPGNGIKDITYESDANGNISVLINFTEEDKPSISFMIPRGIGIKNIAASFNDEGYLVFTFTMSDNTKIEVETESRVTMWHSGSSDPNSVPIGNIGDFYFYIPTLTIYQKTIDGWKEVASLGTKTNTGYKTVTLDLNVNDGSGVPASFVNYYGDGKFSILTGRTFFDSGIELPQAIRNGYTFEGWFIDKTYNEINGRFTNMSAVGKDMTVYAYRKLI